MPPVISIVGKPDCGKTTLLEKLIPELNRQGYRVGTIKHHVHQFQMDTPGKDTWRHKQAGARVVALSSPTGLGIIRDVDHDYALEELVGRYFTDVDLVLTEGYKGAAMPKIEVFRRTAAHAEPLPDPDRSRIAVVSDIPLTGSLPCFAPEDVQGLASFVVERFISPAADRQTSLTVNGRPVPLSRSAESFLHQAIIAMISSLKGCDHPQEMVLTIRNDR